jgi:YD repeat-containing protein
MPILQSEAGPATAARTEIGTMVTAAGPEIFQSAMRYDSLNRLVLTAQQGADGQITSDLLLCCSDPTPPSTLVTLFGFDSRGNQTLTIDPKGNTTVAVFDGANRQTQTLQQMRLGGSGPNPPAGNTSFLESGRGVIRTDVVLDGNGRVVELIDDRGAGTAFGYDPLDRQVTLAFHDGSLRTNIFNAAGDVIGYTVGAFRQPPPAGPTAEKA